MEIVSPAGRLTGRFLTAGPPRKSCPVVKTPSNSGGTGLIPGLGNKILHAAQQGKLIFQMKNGLLLGKGEKMIGGQRIRCSFPWIYL